MRKNFLIPCILLSAMLLSCKDDNNGAVDIEGIKNEIQVLEDSYAKAMNDRNADEAVKYYADDAQSLQIDDATLVGKEEILASLKQEIASFPKNGTIKYTTNETLISNDGDQVVEIGTYRVTYTGDPKIYSGNFMSVFEKREGKWVCVRDMSAPNTPRKE